MASDGIQPPINCGLCKIDSQLKWRCLTCDNSLCDQCKDREHSKMDGAYGHRIINIKDIGTEVTLKITKIFKMEMDLFLIMARCQHNTLWIDSVSFEGISEVRKIKQEGDELIILHKKFMVSICSSSTIE